MPVERPASPGVAGEAPSVWNVPNGLTALRILLVPVLGWLLLSHGGDRVGLRPDRADRGEDHLGTALRDAGQDVTQEVHPAPLPGGAEEDRPDLVERFGITTMPTLVVVEGKTVRAKLERPRGCREIESFLAPWLS